MQLNGFLVHAVMYGKTNLMLPSNSGTKAKLKIVRPKSLVFVHSAFTYKIISRDASTALIEYVYVQPGG